MQEVIEIVQKYAANISDWWDGISNTPTITSGTRCSLCNQVFSQPVIGTIRGKSVPNYISIPHSTSDENYLCLLKCTLNELKGINSSLSSMRWDMRWNNRPFESLDKSIQNIDQVVKTFPINIKEENNGNLREKDNSISGS